MDHALITFTRLKMFRFAHFTLEIIATLDSLQSIQQCSDSLVMFSLETIQLESSQKLLGKIELLLKLSTHFIDFPFVPCSRAFQRFYQKFIETAYPTEDIYMEN